MEELIEYYERRLKTVMSEIEKGGNDLTINRLGTKASCYRTFLTELNRELNIDNDSNSVCECCNENEAKVKVNICRSCEEYKLNSTDC